jgi:hypothetical protein
VNNTPDWGAQQDLVSKSQELARHWWLMPVILVTWEVEIRRTAVECQLGQTVPKTPSAK